MPYKALKKAEAYARNQILHVISLPQHIGDFIFPSQLGQREI